MVESSSSRSNRTGAEDDELLTFLVSEVLYPPLRAASLRIGRSNYAAFDWSSWHVLPQFSPLPPWALDNSKAGLGFSGFD